MSTRRPLVTFALFAYQQERFVREAVASALAQTYSPLQVILSDDHSADRTFTIMQEMVAGYDGPHRILLTRSSSNLGISAHIDRVNALAEGELIVGAAGDDVSAPTRTERLVAAWEEGGRPGLLLSGYDALDAEGRLIGGGPAPTPLTRNWDGAAKPEILQRFLGTWDTAIIGATEAWTLELFTTFGPLPADLVYEDNVLVFRALLSDSLRFVPERLIGYRQHDTNVSDRRWWGDRRPADYREREGELEQMARYWLDALRVYGEDIVVAERLGLVSAPLAATLQAQVAGQVLIEQRLSTWWSASFPERLGWFLRHLGHQSARVPLAWWTGARLLPLGLFAHVASLVGRARSALGPYARAVRSRVMSGPPKG